MCHFTISWDSHFWQFFFFFWQDLNKNFTIFFRSFLSCLTDVHFLYNPPRKTSPPSPHNYRNKIPAMAKLPVIPWRHYPQQKRRDFALILLEILFCFCGLSLILFFDQTSPICLFNLFFVFIYIEIFFSFSRFCRDVPLFYTYSCFVSIFFFILYIYLYLENHL